MKQSKIIGFWNYTVWLTYLSLLIGFVGIVGSLSASGHPYIGTICLFFSGLCDTFDGKVARTKKNRTELEKGFGIQIDSLADIVAFGILPPCIGGAVVRNSISFTFLNSYSTMTAMQGLYTAIMVIVMLFYVLAAMVRLAYFNVTEEERQKVEKKNRTYYEGLPVTAAALIFPIVLVIQYITGYDLSIVYFVVLALTGIAFIWRFKVIKPGNKGISILLVIGAIEFALLLIFLIRKLY